MAYLRKKFIIKWLVITVVALNNLFWRDFFLQ